MNQTSFIGVVFQKFDTEQGVWKGVLETDNAVPICSLLSTCFKDISLLIGNRRVTACSNFNIQAYHILNKLGTSQDIKNTIQEVRL